MASFASTSITSTVLMLARIMVACRMSTRLKRDEDSALKMYYEYAPHTKMIDKNGRKDVRIDVAAYATSNKRFVK
jgi:hypothetical protein